MCGKTFLFVCLTKKIVIFSTGTTIYVTTTKGRVFPVLQGNETPFLMTSILPHFEVCRLFTLVRVSNTHLTHLTVWLSWTGFTWAIIFTKLAKLKYNKFKSMNSTSFTHCASIVHTLDDTGLLRNRTQSQI